MKKMLLGRQQNLYVAFSINGAFTYAIGTNTDPYHHRRWLLELYVRNNPDGSFPL